jgi:hypothetical protein
MQRVKSIMYGSTVDRLGNVVKTNLVTIAMIRAVEK